MAKLIYAAIASLDGYVEDEKGRVDRAARDDKRGQTDLSHRRRRHRGGGRGFLIAPLTFLQARDGLRSYPSYVPSASRRLGGWRPSIT